jgi:hypothetical protein
MTWNEMGVNRHLPHVFVLPEDDANRQVATGFVLDLSRQIQVLPVAGGWTQVLERFLSDHVLDMERNPNRFMVLLIDFDCREQRLDDAKNKIPAGLTERVFILGAWSEPEELRKAGLGSYEQIGLALARDCRERTDNTWGHDLLKNNAGELARMRDHVRSILF